MKNKILIYLIIIVFLFINIFTLTGCDNSDDNKLIYKTENEIQYLEQKIVQILNSLNSISLTNSMLTESKEIKNDESQNENSNNNSSNNDKNNEKDKQTNQVTKYEVKNSSVLNSDKKDIDWEYIKENTEILYSIWSTIIIDLYQFDIETNDIFKFSQTMDLTTLSVANQDKSTSIINFASLYNYLPNFRSKISKDNKKINLDYTIASVVNSYALIEQENWQGIKEQINLAINYFTNVMNIVNEDVHAQAHITKTYVLLNELNNSIDLQNKDLYYIKYKSTMEELIYI